MNYNQKIKEWDNDAVWTKFSIDFLNDMGWNTYEISSSIGICDYKEKKYLVSFRHNINKSAVGTKEEKNIADRIKEHKVEGFIGFYSGNYTTALLDRLISMGVDFKLFNGSRIITFIPFTHSFIIDTHFGSGIKGTHSSPIRYYNNLSNEALYKPLKCICGCGVDILEPANIPYSMVLIHNNGHTIYFCYGLKDCINKISDNTECGWSEITQILHPEQFIEWNECIRNYLEKNKHLETVDFYRVKMIFTMRIMQRMRSINAGLFMRLL